MKASRILFRSFVFSLSLLALAVPAWATSEKLDDHQYLSDFLQAEPSTLDISRRADAYSSSIMVNTMEGLVRLRDVGGQYELSPAGAKSWEHNEDGTVWTFHLRPNKWEDGEAVTAHQYVYSLRRSADPQTGSPSNFFLEPLANFDEVSKGEKAIEELGVKALDDMTLQITLKAPNPMFLSMINATLYYPLRKDKIDQWGEKFGADAATYISNGPFKVTSWTHNNALVLEKNDHYWDAESVHLRKLTLSIMPDETTFYNAFLSGQLDMVMALQPEWVKRFSDEGGILNKIPRPQIAYAFFNAKDALFQNVNIRKAFTLAIDREDLNEMCFGGLRIPTYGWVVPTISVGNINYREMAGDMIAEMKNELEKQGSSVRDLLIAGMKELGLGENPATLKVTFSLAGTNEFFRTLGEFLQQVYKEELGVDVKISYSDWGIFYDNVLKGTYQIGFMSWGAYYNDPYDVLSLFVSSYDAIKTGWKNDEFDSLMKAASVEMDETKRAELYVKAETILIKEQCAVSPVTTSVLNRFMKPWVRGASNLGFVVGDYSRMYTVGRP